jgi:NodT family efflux transporter outer membrane factor (OMF) lipoprotein
MYKITYSVAMGGLWLAVLALVGCRNAPVRPEEPTTPTSWKQAPQVNVASEQMSLASEQMSLASEQMSLATLPQWADLQDPVLLTLQAKVLQANLDIRQAALRLQSSATVLGLKDLRLTPSLSASYGGSKPLKSSPQTVNDGWSQSWSLSASMSWEFDLWGRIAAEREEQLTQHEALFADEQAARVALVSRTAELWWQLGELTARQPFVEEQVNHAEEALPLVRARVQEGKLLPVELDRASIRFLDARNRLADLRAERQLRLQDLALLLGETQLDQVQALSSSARLPATDRLIWTQQAMATPTRILERRPDVLRSRLQVDGALANLKIAQASRYPSLTLTGGVASSGDRLSNWLDQPRGSVSSSLLVPLIDWRRLALQEKSRRTELDMAALALRDTLNKAISEVETCWVEAQRLDRRIEFQEAALSEAQANEARTQVRLEVGAKSLADWLKTQDALLDARQQLLQLQLNAWINQSAFLKALGGAG